MFSKEMPRPIERRTVNSGVATRRDRHTRLTIPEAERTQFIPSEVLIASATDLERTNQSQREATLSERIGAKKGIILGLELASGALGADTVWAYQRESIFEMGTNLCAIALLQVLVYVTSKIVSNNENKPPNR